MNVRRVDLDTHAKSSRLPGAENERGVAGRGEESTQHLDWWILLLLSNVVSRLNIVHGHDQSGFARQ